MAEPGTETLIRSADVSVLTSEGLGELKQLINEAATRHRELQTRLAQEKRRLAKAAGRLSWAEFWVIRLATGKAIPGLVAEANAADRSVAQTKAELDGCFVEVDFGLDEVTEQSFAGLVSAFDEVRTAARIWDITATSAVNRIAQRTTASAALTRVPVSFDYAEPVIVRTRHRPMRLGNVGGRDIQIFPGFIMMRETSGDFALIEFADFDCQLGRSNFIEEDAVPSDAEQIGSTWKRANKDGSRDRRFNDNYQIPVVVYGGLVLSSPTGLGEAYHVSSYLKASLFAKAVASHKSALARLTTSQEQLALPPPSPDAGDTAEDQEPIAPAFSARRRNHLALDWLLLALMLAGGLWTGSQWSRLVTSGRAAIEGPPPAQAAAPTGTISEHAPAPKLKAHRRRRHHAAAPQGPS